MAPPKLLDQVRSTMALRHFSPRTKEAYVYWILKFILFHKKRHPLEMGEAEIRQFLTHLTEEHDVSASTQNQALNGILFLYRSVLQKSLDAIGDIPRAKRPRRLPTVFSQSEARTVLSFLKGSTWIMANILYGSGLRLLECVTMRVKDLDFQRHQIVVRSGKGEKDRVSILPRMLIPHLQKHLESVHRTHREDLADGFGAVSLPNSVERKYPNAAREWQ